MAANLPPGQPTVSRSVLSLPMYDYLKQLFTATTRPQREKATIFLLDPETDEWIEMPTEPTPKTRWHTTSEEVST